jgi:phosphoribosylformylglycinamidine synthase subunit PurSL
MIVYRYEISEIDQRQYQSSLIPKMTDFFKSSPNYFEKRKFYISQCDNEKSSLNYNQSKSEVFCDEISQLGFESCSSDHNLDFNFAIEIKFRAGVTDNSGQSAQEALNHFDIEAKVSTGELYLLGINKGKDEVASMASRILANSLIQEINIYTKEEILSLKRFEDCQIVEVSLEHALEGEVLTFDLQKISETDFNKMNVERCLAMTWDEFSHVKNHYKTNLNNRAITDVELEIIAQSWSEHCKHKIFSANINFTNENGNKTKVESLYKTFIKGSTKSIEKNNNISWLKSVFSDNAGVVRFDDNIDICVKVETHNSPSALDPYGGALTGILGVNRDILGTGMGAMPIANTDVFCFGPIEYPLKGTEQQMPADLLAPGDILEGVHKGVVDGGNKSGIPTVNGAIFFDPSYAGKPLVYVGTVGVMPQKLASGRDGFGKYSRVTDRVVVVGGAVGADGIHGATFSSLELNESSPSTAVQIGDPLMQKKVTDFLLAARDKELFSALTDNGAGGLSSSIGEMATLTGGAKIDLALCPLKYQGLLPYEIMISESQERMSFSVPVKDVQEFITLAKKFGVVASDLGEFNDSGLFEILYKGKEVASLCLNFLHESLKPMELNAKWDGPKNHQSWLIGKFKISLPTDNNLILNILLNCSNIASKEKYVRQYDHEVKAATLVKPFSGDNLAGESVSLGPNDAGVIWLKPFGGNSNNSLSIGCGMAPRLSYFDPKLMAYYSVDEAVRNVVVTGGNVEELCLLDNFCWPDPIVTGKNKDGEFKLGALVKTCQGLSEITQVYGTPLVSGKDSMKNDFKGKNKKGEELKISILPTLLVTAVARTPVSKITTSEFKNDKDFIYLLGHENKSFIGSELNNIFELKDLSGAGEINLKKNYRLYKLIHQTLGKGIINSLHDLSDGGLMVAIAESCLGGNLGADISLEENNLLTLFGEGAGQILASVNPLHVETFEKVLSECDPVILGQVSNSKRLQVIANKELIIDQSIESLSESFKNKF